MSFYLTALYSKRWWWCTQLPSFHLMRYNSDLGIFSLYLINESKNWQICFSLDNYLNMQMWNFFLPKPIFFNLQQNSVLEWKCTWRIPELKKPNKQNHKNPHTLPQVRSTQSSATAINLKEYEENNLRHFQRKSFKSHPHYPTTYKELQYIFVLDIIFMKVYRLYVHTMMVVFPFN